MLEALARRRVEGLRHDEDHQEGDGRAEERSDERGDEVVGHALEGEGLDEMAAAGADGARDAELARAARRPASRRRGR